MTYSIFDVIKDTVAGTTIAADNNKKNNRIEICNTCEFLTKPFRICSKCGCLTDQKVKYDQSTCPLGRW